MTNTFFEDSRFLLRVTCETSLKQVIHLYTRHTHPTTTRAHVYCTRTHTCHRHTYVCMYAHTHTHTQPPPATPLCPADSRQPPTAPAHTVYLFGEPGEEVPSAQEVQNQVEFPLRLEGCRRREVRAFFTVPGVAVIPWGQR